MSEAAAAESAGSGEHAVTPLELFFDLVFVFAITQVTALPGSPLTDPTPGTHQLTEASRKRDSAGRRRNSPIQADPRDYGYVAFRPAAMRC